MTKIPVFRKSNNKPMTIGIFLSGTGTNFEAIINYLEENNINNVKINFVFSNVPDCLGIKNAEDRGFKTFSINSRNFFEKLGKPPDDEQTRKEYDMEVLNTRSEFMETDLIVLAGYRRKFSRIFYNSFNNKIINMYPGDITRDYLVTGKPASIQALQNNDDEIKCTVYIDRENTSFGKAILQSIPLKLECYNEANISELDNEIREKLEWTTLPYAIFEIIAKERLLIDEMGNLYLDEVLLNETGMQL